MGENSRLSGKNRLQAVNDWVRRARAGEPGAWEQLHRHFRGASLAFCRSMLGDEDQAEDVVQEGFLEAVNALHKLRHDEAFAVWFRRILIKQCDRVLRKRPEAADESPGNAVDLMPETYDVGCAGVTPETQLERKEIEARVKRALDELPALERELCMEYYFEQRDQAEISRRMGIPLHTIKNRLLHARRLLRGHLGSGGRAFRPLALAA